MIGRFRAHQGPAGKDRQKTESKLMRMSQLLVPTLREDPADAEVISHKLMLRAGLMRKVSPGIYNYLPLGLRVLRKIETIVREEMAAGGAQELLMPVILPAELWRETGRWFVYGKELLRLNDRHEREYCVGPTHEEVITDLVRREVTSWRQLPLNLFQIQTKFRDEVRPRFGLMRGREFIMKDGYSFDRDEAGALETYEVMYRAYKRIFDRCGLSYRPVEADSGAIGGNKTHEFQVLAESGEDEILSCDHCEYAANTERAECAAPKELAEEEAPALETVATPNQQTIEEVASFLGVTKSRTMKAVAFRFTIFPTGDAKQENEGTALAAAMMAGEKAKTGYALALIRGDRDVNETKVRNAIGADELEPATDEEIRAHFGSEPGYMGPVDGGGKAMVLTDISIQSGVGYVSGANKTDAHYKHTVAGRDWIIGKQTDIGQAEAGNECPRCRQGKLASYRGIEVGQVFMLGTKYSRALNAVYLDEGGKEIPMVMGCYGIGIGRTAAAAVEQNHDDKGIIWPLPIAPYALAIVSLPAKDGSTAEAAENLFAELQAAGVEVLYDDRDETAGVKLNDADLVGVPWRIVVGARGLKEGAVEVKQRQSGEVRKVALEQINEFVAKCLETDSFPDQG